MTKRHKDDLFSSFDISFASCLLNFNSSSLQVVVKDQAISRVATICYHHPVCCTSVVLCCRSSWSLTHPENNFEMDAKLRRTLFTISLRCAPTVWPNGISSQSETSRVQPVWTKPVISSEKEHYFHHDSCLYCIIPALGICISHRYVVRIPTDERAELLTVNSNPYLWLCPPEPTVFRWWSDKRSIMTRKPLSSDSNQLKKSQANWASLNANIALLYVKHGPEPLSWRNGDP